MYKLTSKQKANLKKRNGGLQLTSQKKKKKKNEEREVRRHGVYNR